MFNWLRSKKTYDFYVAGPMRGYKDLNKQMFAMAAMLLRARGFTIWSPSEHDSYLKLSFAQCMTADLNAIINQCSKIALLPGWRDSLGANMEVFSAFACGRPVFELVSNDDGADYDIVQFDSSSYVLPYKIGVTRKFNPHLCELESFTQK